MVLSGCGFLDGSEIHEAVSLLVHLDRAGLASECFAPDVPQADVVNHATKSPVADERRSVLAESARIARGRIRPLASLHAADFDAIALPGGFGAAKTLCTFAADGPACRILPDVARVITEFHAARKPIGLCCIAPVLAAKVLGTAAGGPGCEVTLGHDAGVARAIAAMGARHVDKPVTAAHTDAAHRVVTTPAYMEETGPYAVFTGIGAMVDELTRLLRG